MVSSQSTGQHHDIAVRMIDQRSWVTDVAVSPDGDRVAFVVATIDLEANTTERRIWLDDVPVTEGDHDDHPAWSPDGRFLAFRAKRSSEKTDATMHVLPVDAPGESRTVCTMPDGLGDIAWSPDGTMLAFTSRTQHERYTKEDASWQAPRKVERLFSRLNGENWIFDRPRHVYVVPADGTGRPRNLTPGEFQHSGVSWLPDSDAIVTSAQRHETWDIDLAVDLYVVPVSGDGEIRCLTAHDGSYSHPSVSPDGKLVAFLGHGDLLTFPQNAAVGVAPLDATTKESDIIWASAGLDRTFMPLSGTRAPVWRDDISVLAAAEDRGETHLFHVFVDGSQVPEPLTDGPIVVSGFDAAAGTIATVRSTVDRPDELFLGGVQQTHVTARWSDDLLPWEKFEVPTTDGSDVIDAWIMRPADFDETNTYPVLLNVHGGPFAQYGEGFFDEAQFQAAAGFVVVLSNPRGGSGRSTEWGQAILGPKHPVKPGSGWGGLDADDVLAVIDHTLERFTFCDRDRVGMLGGSYGGYMATWLAANHDGRFRAFCSERAVNNLVSEEWSSDIATAFRTEHGPLHIDDPELYASHSPIRQVREIDRPMLLIHSEEDWRCPINQAEELWVALKLLGKEVDFYRFPGENHELSRSGSPVHRVQRAEIILDWFTEKLA
ncbi:alpha/beta hydrolase family protein [Ilumatobacter nonamiensis]|uniref:alpha/beta hydrolase family protein n=1 Tax=Ilumatobacter nonamiensis TaxID=467093 RepID=UPI000348ADF7|nr:S9 family peptidase [Ilumatobacter nonamiensis]